MVECVLDCTDKGCQPHGGTRSEKAHILFWMAMIKDLCHLEDLLAVCHFSEPFNPLLLVEMYYLANTVSSLSQLNAHKACKKRSVNGPLPPR